MEKKKKFKKAAIFIFLLLIIFYITSGYLVNEIYYYNSSRSFTSYIIYGIIIFISLIMVIFTFKGFKTIKKHKKKSYALYFILILLCISSELFISYNLNKISSSLSKITNEHSNYSSSLIVMKDSNINNISDLNNFEIGIISDENNVEGYIIANEIINDNNIKEDALKSYDTFTEMLQALYDDDIKAAFVSSSYASLFSNTEGFEDIANKVKVIVKKDKKIKKDYEGNTKTLTEPFNVLIMGVDSEKGSLSSSSSLNGDTLMLITFNPNTMNATILSIPRDTLVPIACYKNNAKNKINSAAYGGAECMIKTIENLTDIKIDYWVKVNFKGVISLVDALGGIKVDVPYAFCESNSNRQFGKNTIYVEKGLQTLNGEQALAFARNRHTWPQYCGKKYSKYTSNDFIRGQNQQKIVNAMLNRLKQISTLQEIYSILNVVGDNIDTNIDKETMITGFDTFKKLLSKSRNIESDDFVGTQRLYLSGYDKYINGIYYYQYYKQSLEEIVTAMKINLELKEPVMDKEFSFSINSPYTNTQIGKGTYKY